MDDMLSLLSEISVMLAERPAILALTCSLVAAFSSEIAERSDTALVAVPFAASSFLTSSVILSICDTE